MLKRSSVVLVALAGALMLATVSCRMEPDGTITASRFHTMLDEAADGGEPFFRCGSGQPGARGVSRNAPGGNHN